VAERVANELGVAAGGCGVTGGARGALGALGGAFGFEGSAVLGPAPLFRLKGRERAQVVIKASEVTAAVPAVRRAVEAVAAERAAREVAFAVDVDPH
jgi:primosomal protein N' (replication factor Y) (superfamily II helicase)